MSAATVSKDIADEFDSLACDFCESYKESGLSKSSRILLGYLKEEGLTGKTVLDLGCGAGSFCIEALKEARCDSSAKVREAAEKALAKIK